MKDQTEFGRIYYIKQNPNKIYNQDEQYLEAYKDSKYKHKLYCDDHTRTQLLAVLSTGNLFCPKCEQEADYDTGDEGGLRNINNMEDEY